MIDDLNALGIPQSALDTITLANMHGVAPALGNLKRGEAFLLEMRSRVQTLRAAVPTFSRPPKVMVERWPKPAIGAKNAFEKIEKRSSAVSLEVAIAANPDLICCLWCGVKKL